MIWYDYIWAGRYDDYDEPSDFAYDSSSMEYSEPLEYYSQLSGAYEGRRDQTTLSISIYSSQEEGEAAIGNAEMYIDDEWYYLGRIIPESEQDVYLVETDTGEEVVLEAYTYDSTIVIELYVDGEFIDEYWMVEHYES